MAAVALWLGASTALAASGAAPAGSTGHDVSYPQCTYSGSPSTTVGSLGGAFGIVGVTDGLPWSSNSCLASEYQWAGGLTYQRGLYTNTANPAPHSSFFWPTSGSYAPALCKDSTSTADPGCAYDYGWHAAQNALSTAEATISGANGAPWWLDVESANSWNGDGSSNAADLQGFVDYLRGPGGIPSVGLYSSSSAWVSITGGYTVNNASSYQSAWSSEIPASPYPLSGSPTWVAGAGSDGSTTCSALAFTGTLPALAQYMDGTGYDADLVCGSPTQQPSFTFSVAPTSETVAASGSTTANVSVNESGPSQSVSLSASGQPSGVTVGFSPSAVSSSTSSTMTVTVGSAVPAGTYPLTITATGASSGAQTSTYTLTVATPAPPSVSVALGSTSASVKPGGSKQVSVTVSERGNPQGVSLAVTVSPSPASAPTASVTPSTLPGPGSATLTLRTTSRTSAARYTIVVTATETGGGASGSATYTLAVR